MRHLRTDLQSPAGARGNVMYFALIALLHLHFVFSGALPVDGDEPSRGEHKLLKWSEAVDERGMCRVAGILPADCNSCSCQPGLPPACTLMACPPAERQVSGKTCKPGSKWKVDCNRCLCSEGGVPHCTLQSCGSAGQHHQQLLRHLREKLDKDGKCFKNEAWNVDCNSCFCLDEELYCTKKHCADRHKRASGKINPGGKCKPGDRWDLDSCNKCVCTHTGYASCSLNDCSTTQKRPKRSPAETGKINPGGKCKPGDRWDLDSCNKCVCTHTGYASCSLNDCSTTQKRPKRSPAETGKINPGGKCKPGDRWDLDSCNKCVCTHTGYASCSLNDCSTKQKRPKRSPAETGKIPPGGKCEPGKRWKIDDCNNCVCTHTGFASCTLNDCKKNQRKRSTDGSQLSDFVDENYICKETVQFKLDCNTCNCLKGASAACTLMGCPEYTNRTQRFRRDTDQSNAVSDSDEFLNEEARCKKTGSFPMGCNVCSCMHTGGHPFCTQMLCTEHVLSRKTRNARSGNGNSGLECKPGVSWKENCNSCFCSERGIAMCTDIPTCPSPPPAPLKEGISPIFGKSLDLSTNVTSLNGTDPQLEPSSNTTDVNLPSQELQSTNSTGVVLQLQSSTESYSASVKSPANTDLSPTVPLSNSSSTTTTEQ